MKLTAYNNYTYQKPRLQNQNFKQTQVSKEPVSFGSIGLIAATGAFTGLLATFIASHASGKTTKTSYTPKITSKNGWSENVKVLASTSQRYLSYGLDDKESYNTNAYIDSLYGDELLHKMEQSDGIIDAHNKIGKIVKGDTLSNGFNIELKKYKYANMFPVSTPNNLNCWNKNDKEKQRFILSIGGSEHRHSTNIDVFSKKMQKTFNIPSSNIIKVRYAEPDEVKSALEELSDKIKDLSKDDAEILIYYSGHGQVKKGHFLGWTNNFKKEGASTGVTEVGLKEKELKKFTKEQINGINTLIIMDTCHSGAWIC